MNPDDGRGSLLSLRKAYFGKESLIKPHRLEISCPQTPTLAIHHRATHGIFWLFHIICYLFPCFLFNFLSANLSIVFYISTTKSS
jgi:hypothetical protein